MPAAHQRLRNDKTVVSLCGESLLELEREGWTLPQIEKQIILLAMDEDTSLGRNSSAGKGKSPTNLILMFVCVRLDSSISAKSLACALRISEFKSWPMMPLDLRPVTQPLPFFCVKGIMVVPPTQGSGSIGGT